MVVSVLAVTASSWGVLMGLAPVLQIRRMLRERSSREVSLGYFMILLAGFLLWISYGMAARDMALVIPNGIALLVGLALVAVALRLRHSSRRARPRSERPVRRSVTLTAPPIPSCACGTRNVRPGGRVQLGSRRVSGQGRTVTCGHCFRQRSVLAW